MTPIFQTKVRHVIQLGSLIIEQPLLLSTGNPSRENGPLQKREPASKERKTIERESTTFTTPEWNIVRSFDLSFFPAAPHILLSVAARPLLISMAKAGVIAVPAARIFPPQLARGKKKILMMPGGSRSPRRIDMGRGRVMALNNLPFLMDPVKSYPGGWRPDPRRTMVVSAAAELIWTAIKAKGCPRPQLLHIS